MIKKAGKRIIFFYEVFLAPYCLSFLFWPIVKICKIFNIIFVVNIAHGVGHVFAETDNFLRIKFLDKSLSYKKFILVSKPYPIYIGMKKIYNHHFYKFFCGYFSYLLLLPLTVRFKDIILDCGISRMKWQIGPNIVKRSFPSTYLQRLSKIDGITQTCRYYQRCAATQYFTPLVDIRSEKKVISTTKKLALISLKTLVRNATALPTNPDTLLKSLNYLIKQGYFLVFVGREVMPSCFKKLDIFDYANSPLASFENDILLFNQSDIVITSGSGISFLADRLNKSFLYINSWHLQMSMPSKKCVMIPTILRGKKNRSYLKFSEQMKLYKSSNVSEHFNLDNFEAINATSDEILHGINELLELSDSLTDLQKKYKCLGGETCPLRYGKSRCSYYFLSRHEDLLG